VIATASAVRGKLDETLQQLTTTIESARDHGIEQASATRSALLSGIDSSLQAALRQLDQQEHDQRQTIDDTCYLQQVLQEQMAHSAAASLQGLVTGGASALNDSLRVLRSKFASSQAPDPQALDEALSVVSRKVDEALGGMQKGLVAGAASAVQQLGIALGAGLAALDGLVASNDQTVAALAGGFGSSMGAIAGQDNFASQRSGFTQMMAQATTGGAAGFQQILGAMRDGCGKVTADAQKALPQAAGDLEKNLRQSKLGIECQITKDADEAASHEAPAWKRLIAVLLIIVVIVIVIVVTVLTAGAGLGLLAVIALGAVVGAVTSGLIAMATNLWTNQAVTKGVAHAMLAGAIAGAAGGVIGMGVGAIVGKVAGTALSVAAKEFATVMISTAVIDVGSQFFEGGFSFKKFSLKNLAVDLAVALVVHKALGGVKAAGAKGGAPVEPTTAQAVPTEPIPTEPAPVEPAPTESVPAEPTPTKPAPAEPAPAPAETPAVPAPAETPAAPLPTETPATPAATETPVAPGPATGPKRMGTVSAGPEGIVEHPIPTPEVETATSRRGSLPPSEASATPEVPETISEPVAERGSTSEDIAEVHAQQTETTPEVEQADIAANADEVPDQRHPRTSKQTTGPERARAAAEAEERQAAAAQGRTEEESGSQLPDETREGNLFDDPNAAPNQEQIAKRQEYMGSTPGKDSPTGRDVQTRMRSEVPPTLRENPVTGNTEFQASDGEWYPLKDADMSHRTDAVKYWNETGRYYGKQSPEVREWMTDPDNYVLDHYRINRSAGAKLTDRYLPLPGEEE
jgi:hypothetical protein